MKSKTLESKNPQQDLIPSDFSSAITTTAVAQICQTVGFRAAQRSALQTLADVAARYLRSLATAAASSASSTGRTQSNLIDILHALEDLHSVHGFAGASNACRSLLSSSILTGIMRFVDYTDEIPFAKPIPRPNFVPNHSIFPPNSCLAHVPRWLPEMPEVGNGERRRGEERFEEVSEACLVAEKIGVEKGKERGGGMELPVKRGKVRFKMGGERFGVDLRSGVCRGGKRVSCQIWSDNEGGKYVRSKR